MNKFRGTLSTKQNKAVIMNVYNQQGDLSFYLFLVWRFTNKIVPFIDAIKADTCFCYTQIKGQLIVPFIDAIKADTCFCSTQIKGQLINDRKT